MNTPNEPAPLVESPTVTHANAGQKHEVQTMPAAAEIDPNNPPWGVIEGLLTWLGSVLLLLVVPFFLLLPYVIYRNAQPAVPGQLLLEDKTALFLAVISTLPVHLLTFGLVWAVVTRFRKRPFWSALGWSWSRRVGFWTSAGLAILLLAAGLLFTNLAGGEPTEIDRLIQSSTASRFALAILAATTAPFVEELVYRGVLYPALQRTIGMFWAVVGVSILFTLPHIPQYINNVAVISVVFVLSLSLTLVRAFTGKLLPCFIMHLVFNGIQSALIIAGPYIQQEVPEVEQKAPAIAMLAQSALHLF